VKRYVISSQDMNFMDEWWKRGPEAYNRFGFQVCPASRQKMTMKSPARDHFGNMKIYLSQKTTLKVINDKTVYDFTDCNGLGKCSLKITQGMPETVPEPFQQVATSSKSSAKKDPLSSAFGKSLGKLGKK